MDCSIDRNKHSSELRAFTRGCLAKTRERDEFSSLESEAPRKPDLVASNLGFHTHVIAKMVQDSPREVGKLFSKVLASAGVLNAIAYCSSRAARIFAEEL